MFEYLTKIDERLYERYLTVERNIKSGSNSFYDSFLDMQEQFIKIVAINENIDVPATATCGKLLHNYDIRDYFLITLQLDPNIFEKMLDYSQKVNSHKHTGEKHIQVDTIINYLKIFFIVSSTYLKTKIESLCEFNADEIISIFGIYEKENIELKEEVNRLKEDLNASVENGKLKDSDIIAYKSLISQAEIEKLSLSDQNIELQKQISKLKDIKLSSMEDKLNKTIDLLFNMQDYLIENRIIDKRISKLIDGKEISDEEIRQERIKMEINNGRK